jgi:uncharacterized membrane protein
MVLVSAFLIGLVTGLRSMTPLAVVSWSARLGALALENTPLAFFGYRYTPIVFTVFAIAELVVDKLPTTPSRKAPPGFITRIVVGALVGAAIGASARMLIGGLLLGVVGAVAGTLGGAAVRQKMAAVFGRDLPAALVEDVAAVGIAILSIVVLR